LIIIVTPLALYLASLAFGGLFIGASVFGGHDSHGGGGEGHGGGGHGGGGHDHQGGSDDHGHDQQQSALLPLLSIRFWTFALAFFGLTGAVLTLIGGLPALVVPAVAGGMGLGAGYGASRMLGTLASRPVGLLKADAQVGREGRVLLPIDRNQRGKVRLEIGGVTTDLVAITEGNEKLPAGSTALVIGMRGTLALVERSPAAPALSAADKEEDT
jgi:hypothetical protein